MFKKNYKEKCLKILKKVNEFLAYELEHREKNKKAKTMSHKKTRHRSTTKLYNNTIGGVPNNSIVAIKKKRDYKTIIAYSVTLIISVAMFIYSVMIISSYIDNPENNHLYGSVIKNLFKIIGFSFNLNSEQFIINLLGKFTTGISADATIHANRLCSVGDNTLFSIYQYLSFEGTSSCFNQAFTLRMKTSISVPILMMRSSMIIAIKSLFRLGMLSIGGKSVETRIYNLLFESEEPLNDNDIDRIAIRLPELPNVAVNDDLQREAEDLTAEAAEAAEAAEGLLLLGKPIIQHPDSI